MRTTLAIKRNSAARATSTLALAISALIAINSAHAEVDGWQQVKKDGVLRCGTAVTAPYVTRDPKTQTYSGPFPELCKGFAKQLGVKIEFIDSTWPNMIAGIQSHKWDMGLALTDTPEREKAIRFSAPVIHSSVTFSYNKNNAKLDGGPKSFADLDKSEVTVAVMSGSVADQAITQELKKANIMRLPGTDESRLAFLSKRADVLADDSATNMLTAAAHKDSVKVFEPNPPVMSQPAGFGLSKDVSDADMAVLNKYIEDQEKSGAIDKLTKQGVAQALAGSSTQ